MAPPFGGFDRRRVLRTSPQGKLGCVLSELTVLVVGYLLALAVGIAVLVPVLSL